MSELKGEEDYAAQREIAEVARYLTPQRLSDYLVEVEGDVARAIQLYEWNSRMAVACFSAIGHLEVLLRNSVDEVLTNYAHETTRGIPWFLLRDSTMPGFIETAVDAVRNRLAAQGIDETRDRIIANFTMGFWVRLLGSDADELWKHATHQAFSSAGRPAPARKTVAGLADGIRKSRNRVAHHNFLKEFDIPSAMSQVFALAGLISPDFCEWMRRTSDWEEIYRDSPHIDADTVVVAGAVAWEVHKKAAVYVCRSGRYFRPETEHMAFYENRSVRAQVPRIIRVFDDVEFSSSAAKEFSESSNPEERKLGRAISWALSEEGEETAGGWGHDRYKVFLLTPYRESQNGQDEHVVLDDDIRHRAQGRGSAFTQRQRYVPLRRLRTARTTADLAAPSEI